MSESILNTSWQDVHKWYHQQVGKWGTYYQQEVIFPNLLKIFEKENIDSLLDLGCGEGIVSRILKKDIDYTGLDLSESLLDIARKQNTKNNAEFIFKDALRFSIEKKDFSHALFLLSLQNMENPLLALKSVSKHLKLQGKLIIVLNHPCFRIPKQSDWGFDEKTKVQYRKVNKYLSPLKIPIQHNPSLGLRSKITWSFHQPLSFYISCLNEAGFIIEDLQEWISNKTSTGGRADAENITRKEIPLFMTIIATRNKLYGNH